MKNKICHRTMGSVNRSNCVEDACTAWGVIGYVSGGRSIYGCRDVNKEKP
jgi:hypothetical protein